MASTVLVSAYGCGGFLYGREVRKGGADGGAPKVEVIIQPIKSQNTFHCFLLMQRSAILTPGVDVLSLLQMVTVVKSNRTYSEILLCAFVCLFPLK